MVGCISMLTIKISIGYRRYSVPLLQEGEFVDEEGIEYDILVVAYDADSSCI